MADGFVDQAPAVVAAARLDPLRDEGEACLKRLFEAGCVATPAA